MPSEIEARLKTLALIIKFGHDLFDSRDLESVAAAAVNNSYSLMKFRSSALFRLHENDQCSLLGQFGEVEINEFSAVVQLQKKVIAENRFEQEFLIVENDKLPGELAENGSVLLLCRLTPPAVSQQKGTYIWLLEYEGNIPEHSVTTAQLLGKNIAESLSLAETAAAGKWFRGKQFLKKSFRFVALFICLAGIMFIPVRESSTAEFMLKAPEITAAYARFDGAVAECLKQDGGRVRKGETVLRLDTAALDYRLANAQAELKEAQADLELAQQNAFVDESKLGNVKLLKARCNILQVAVAEARWFRTNSEIKAPADGILVLTEEGTGELTGKAVRAGEKVFDVYGGRGMIAEIMVNERDSSILREQFGTELFLHTAPEKGITGKIVFISQYPILNEQKQYCYQVRVKLPEKENKSLRFGMRGIAKLSGGNVTLGYLLFKSLILYFRNW